MTLTPKQKKKLAKTIGYFITLLKPRYNIDTPLDPEIVISQRRAGSNSFMGNMCYGSFVCARIANYGSYQEITLNPRLLRSNKIDDAIYTISHEIAHWIQLSIREETLCRSAVTVKKLKLTKKRMVLVEEHDAITSNVFTFISDSLLYNDIRDVLIEGNDYRPLPLSKVA